MTTVPVSNECYSELSITLKRMGREINDGKPLSLEKGDAIVPPQDFRMVAIRQNCLGAAVEAWKNSDKKQTFLECSENIFKWCLSGEKIDKTEPFVEGVSNNPNQGWDKK